ncbi:MAG: acyl-CoA/acyl-ACP dehydrogenase [Chloroflexi bacterium]|nr:acyl-CoA/acyl-ACP dehydrogenase [Chloroflexota bacterium]
MAVLIDAPGPTVDGVVAPARALAARFAETAAEYDRTAVFPFANFDELRAEGLLNLTVPAEFGGLGMGLEPACRVVQEIARGEPSTALVLAMHYIYSAVPAVVGTWPPEVHAQMYRESVAGIALVNVMRVEPELGTPTRGGIPATTAHRDGTGWRLTGHKLYATGSPILRYFLTWARTGDPEPEVGFFLVPRDTPGLEIVETWDHLGMRATGSHDLLLHGVRIPAEYALDIRPPAAWIPPEPVTGAWNNLVLAALYVGIAHAARNWLAGYLHERVPANLGASLATLPRFQAAMGEIETLLFAADRLVFGLAAEADRDGYTPELAAGTTMAKYTATNNAVRAVEIAIGLIGNPGLSRTNPLERHYRDVLCGRVHVPQDDMVLSMAGKAALGAG